MYALDLQFLKSCCGVSWTDLVDYWLLSVIVCGREVRFGVRWNIYHRDISTSLSPFFLVTFIGILATALCLGDLMTVKHVHIFGSETDISIA